jgi:excisionase family DNA binding protein
MSSSASQPDLSLWLTRERAAEQLKRSVATIDRWIIDKKLKSAERPRPGKKPEVIVDPADVERLRPHAPASPAYIVPTSTWTPNPTANTTGNTPAVSEGFLSVIAQVRTIVAAMAEPQRFVSVKEAAGLTGLSMSYVWRLVKSGELPSIRDGRAWKIRRKDLATL